MGRKSGYRIAVGLMLGLAMAALPASAETRPVVIELFTSQGCSSCPPADALFGELARRGDVLALGFHVNYWDDLGWKDPLSSAQATDRQRSYAGLFGHGMYTPQLVVEGTDEVIGSRREEVMSAIADASHQVVAPVSFAADRHTVVIGGAPPGKAGSVLLVRFVRYRTTPVAAGENAGRTLQDSNAVEAMALLGNWDGSEAKFAIEPPAAGEGLAVLVQAPDGHILGAATIAG